MTNTNSATIPASPLVGKAVKYKCPSCRDTGRITWTDYSNGQGLDIDREDACDKCADASPPVPAFKTLDRVSATPQPAVQLSGWQDIESATKVDGEDILALVKNPWDKEPKRRIICWNDGIDKVGYTWECWMCSVTTLSVCLDAIIGWQPLPAPPQQAIKTRGGV